MTREQVRSEVNKVKWFHSIDLGDGLITPGWEGESTRQKLGLLSLPEDLRGLTVLDIGAWDGFFSFEQSAAALRVSSPPIPIRVAPSFSERVVKAFKQVISNGSQFGPDLKSARMVVHAWR